METIYGFHGLLRKINRVFNLKKRYFSFFKELAITLVRRQTKWSIGIYTGQSLLDFVSTENICCVWYQTAKLDEVND